MEIKVLASGSKGNAYWVSDGVTPLLLECGIRFQEIREKLNFRVSSLGGCLISHAHQDHSRSAQRMMDAGVDIYLSHGTMDHLALRYHRVNVIRAGGQFSVGTWSILSFDIEHDADEPLGFLLANTAGQKLLYLTDSAYCRYRFTGLTHIMVECNFSAEILKATVASGAIPVEHKRRVMRSHFSLEHVKEFLLANDLSQVQEVWLLHLSDGNSNAQQFKAEIEAAIGKVVHIA